MTIKFDGQKAALPNKTSEIVRAVVEISAEIEHIVSGHARSRNMRRKNNPL
jgi:hypothetical protein